MIFTWLKYGKPDVSMCLNASLAGLVAITASCDVTDCAGALIIGAIAGLLVVFGVWFCDHIVHVDDPVGAVAVHMMNGIWGTIAVGLFATASAPGFASAGIQEGIFYGGGFTQLGLQLAGFVTVAAWAALLITITFFVIRATVGLRVSAEEEIEGLDATEHGLPSAYTDFMPAGNRFYKAVPAGAPITMGDVPVKTAVPVSEVPSGVKSVRKTAGGDVKFTKISVICRQSKFEDLKEALSGIGVKGITVTQVLGCGVQKGTAEYYRGVPVDFNLLPKTKVEVVVSAVPVDKVIETARQALYTGHIGDGKIFVYDVENVVKVRTGESGYDALQGDE